MAQVGFIRVGARTDEAPIGGGISLVLDEWYGGEKGLLGEREDSMRRRRASAKVPGIGK